MEYNNTEIYNKIFKNRLRVFIEKDENNINSAYYMKNNNAQKNKK